LQGAANPNSNVATGLDAWVFQVGCDSQGEVCILTA
jgi:hypothetical protein